MRVGRLYLAVGSAVVPDPYAVIGDIAGGGAAWQKKCNMEWKAAHSETVYSLYSNSLLGRTPDHIVFTGRSNAYLCINSCAFFKKVL